MRFLVDADLPRPTVELLRRLGHEAVDVREIGLAAAADERFLSQTDILARLPGRLAIVGPHRVRLRPA